MIEKADWTSVVRDYSLRMLSEYGTGFGDIEAPGSADPAVYDLSTAEGRSDLGFDRMARLIGVEIKRPFADSVGSMGGSKTGAAHAWVANEEKIKIVVKAAGNGTLADIRVGGKSVAQGNVRALLNALTDRLRPFIPPGQKAEDQEVELDADRNLQYAYIILVTDAIKRARIVKINFTDPMAAPPDQ